MATYTTLEEIKYGFQDDLFHEDRWELRPEQREAIDLAKSHFCKRSGKKGEYEWTPDKTFRQFLWNAKMRFGKTICALQLAREMDVKRTLIVTHRPVVEDNWLEAFKQTFGDKIKGNTNVSKQYAYGTRSEDETKNKGNFYDLEKFVQTTGNHYVFFVSMQYLRLSELVNPKTQAKHNVKQDQDFLGNSSIKENEKLKSNILQADWDLVVIDEAHEGTRTALGKKVIDEYLGQNKKNVKVLHLSGTPFNLYEDFEDDEIYTWDYVLEQQAKYEWDTKYPGTKNPYAELPQLKIFTYDITRNIDNILGQDGLFSFSEFFRTWTGNPKADHSQMPPGYRGRFVHEKEVLNFLDLLCTKDDKNNFPFSTKEYRQTFRHTLWVVSHVNEAKALEQLLKEHQTFKRFNIINVAGSNPDDETYDNALDKVISAIGDLPEKTNTITISCGRLTTGVTVKPWTAVFYMKGGDGAATYMQTIFRVQSPYTSVDGKMKTTCYVFDFAPDRTLKIVAETAKFSSMAQAKENKSRSEEEDSTQEQRDKKMVQEFIKLCPVISMEGGQMSPLDVSSIYKKLENVFIDRLVRKGFDDPCLYVQEELNKINPDIINTIGMHGGKAPDENRKDAKASVDLSHMTEEQRRAWEEKIKEQKAKAKERAEKKAQKDEDFKKQWEHWTEAQREEWLEKEAEKQAIREKRKEEREEFKKRMTNIRGIALRIPLLMYGGADAGDTQEDITVDNFTRKIKEESWIEFMPKGITKEDFNKIKKCFNATRFEEAGKKYRALTREADFMHVNDRIRQITEIFSYFRNPDKETVLTPWRVVNMHMSDTIGGWCFFDETFDEKSGQLTTPRYIEHGTVTQQLFNNVDLSGEVQTKILEINSKTGLYPLYVTYSLYRRRLDEYIKAECIDPATVSVQEEQVVWDDIVTDNLFVICNTPMAVGITRRTLFGFREVEKKANIKNKQLIEQAAKDPDALVKELSVYGFWKGTTSKQMIQFNAVVGNPPYQINVGKENKNYALTLYDKFMILAKRLNPQYISMIFESRWFTGGRGLDDFRQEMLNDDRLSKIHDFVSSTDCFPKVDIAGGICYLLWEKDYHGLCEFTSEHLGISTTQMRKLNEYDVFIRRNDSLDIVKKIQELDELKFSDYVSKQTPFGFISSYKGRPTPFKDSIKLLGSYGEVSYVSINDVTRNSAWVDKYKIIFTKAAPGGGSSDKNGQYLVLTSLQILLPKEICTQTFLVGMTFDNLQDCERCLSYLKTRFVRFLISQTMTSQDLGADKFKFVPLQDFSENSDINWEQSISNIDHQLYQKYGIDLFEQEYIESLIKPME